MKRSTIFAGKLFKLSLPTLNPCLLCGKRVKAADFKTLAIMTVYKIL